VEVLEWLEQPLVQFTVKPRIVAAKVELFQFRMFKMAEHMRRDGVIGTVKDEDVVEVERFYGTVPESV